MENWEEGRGYYKEGKLENEEEAKEEKRGKDTWKSISLKTCNWEKSYSDAPSCGQS